MFEEERVFMQEKKLVDSYKADMMMICISMVAVKRHRPG